jgi:hypothetical protein
MGFPVSSTDAAVRRFRGAALAESQGKKPDARRETAKGNPDDIKSAGDAKHRAAQTKPSHQPVPFEMAIAKTSPELEWPGKN